MLGPRRTRLITTKSRDELAREYNRLVDSDRRRDRRTARWIAQVLRDTAPTPDARDRWAQICDVLDRGLVYKMKIVAPKVLAGDELVLRDTERDVLNDPGLDEALREIVDRHIRSRDPE